jgi:putative CocE/NonD family hydrolase
VSGGRGSRHQGAALEAHAGKGGFVKLLKHLLAVTWIVCAVQAGAADNTAPDTVIPRLASQTLSHYRDGNRGRYLRNLFSLQWAAGQFGQAAATAATWRANASGQDVSRTIGELLYVGAQTRMARDHIALEDALQRELRAELGRMSGRQAVDVEWTLITPPSVHQDALQQALAQGTEHLTQDQQIALVNAYLSSRAYESLAPFVNPVIAEDDARRYDIKDDVLIKTPDGATLSAMVVRSKDVKNPQPVALFTAVETRPWFELYQAKYAAAHGYVGVASDTRGKRLSPDDIVLYEDDAQDLYWVIDWLSRQPWSDGRVGMWGGSASGFMQWAAAKTRHPALKTIVPYCPESPGWGLPMQNNVFLNANWAVRFYLTDNKYVDDKISSQSDRWRNLLWTWYTSGRPYREIDQIDGTPDPWLHRFLAHPSFDHYYQQMTVYGDDFAQLRIPVLAIDGYYDDGQSFAMLNLQEHYRHDPHAQHYLLIGPYDHFGTQSGFKPPLLRGYAIDPVAQMDTREITFQWLDHVMRGAPMPALLQDRINYEVMGANVWRHAPSLEQAHNALLPLYLSDAREGPYRTLARTRPAQPSEVRQTVDLADRHAVSAATYPFPILSPQLDTSSGLSFVSEPLQEPLAVAGLFTANLKLVTNKKDLDIAMVLYEVTPDGQFFHLAYVIQRASYARDMTERHLLEPGRLETVPIEHTLFVSRQLRKGSRLLVVLDVNKGPWAQINYGTGRDVSDESIADAKEPLQIAWHTDSEVDVPVWK